MSSPSDDLLENQVIDPASADQSSNLDLVSGEIEAGNCQNRCVQVSVY